MDVTDIKGLMEHYSIASYKNEIRIIVDHISSSRFKAWAYIVHTSRPLVGF